jgi:mRNA-degrading endonuclease YafQ of YafQ-DinJ toxin-antitoxin module
MPRIGKRQLEAIQQQLHEYDVTLTKIIPRDIEQGNDTVREEIFHLLTNRDWLEKQFRRHGITGHIAPLWQRVQELDYLLMQQREMILEAYSSDYYRSQRERLQRSREYWWWYLDDLEAAELPEWVMAESHVGRGG